MSGLGTAASLEASIAAVDARLSQWRQADVADYRRFSHLANAGSPVTPASARAAEGRHGLIRVTSEVDGLVVLTQTCDIRRSSRYRPYVELAPLVRVSPEVARAAWAMERPRYAALPALGEDMVADLDRVTTVEKGVLAGWSRTPGWNDDSQVRRFSSTVARRYGRFAFPDEFAHSLSKLTERIKSRHGKANSAEGRLLESVLQIRVEASPSWADPKVDVQLTFVLQPGTLPILEDAADPSPSPATLVWCDARRRQPADIAARLLAEKNQRDRGWLWVRLAEAWAALCVPVPPINEITVEVLGADEYTMDRYWTTEQLDLDHLSLSDER